VTILRHCRQAMAGASTLVVIERLLPDRVERSIASEAMTSSDVIMMVMNGSRERSAGEHRGAVRGGRPAPLENHLGTGGVQRDRGDAGLTQSPTT